MFDVVVIGAGIMGAAVSRELSRYELKTLLLDKENDVSCGTTKANSAIVHAGYDAKEGSLMAKYNVLGNAMYGKLCEEVDAPFRKVGSYVLAFSEKEKEHLEMLYQRGLNNGVPEMEIIDAAEIQRREPHVSKEAVAALYAGTAGITGPWELTIKLVENAMENGVELKLNAEVANIKKENDVFKIELKNGEIIEAKAIVNAAGVYADFINNMLSNKKFNITPRIGEYYLLDKVQGYLTDSVIFQCPTEMGKGILVSKTAHGNIIVGPTASDVDNKDDVGNTQAGLDTVRQFATKSIKDVNFRDNIRNFAGLRAEADTGDFILGEAEDVKGLFNIAGTKSPGLTSAPAMAIDLAKMIEEKAEVIKKDPRYGRIICRCENITEGEIVDAIHRKCGGTTLNGIKRRVRPGAGRCQGGFCGPRVQEILARELGEDLEEIVMEQKDSYILTGKTK